MNFQKNNTTKTLRMSKIFTLLRCSISILCATLKNLNVMELLHLICLVTEKKNSDQNLNTAS